MRRILPALFLAIVLAAGVVPASADQDDPRLGALFATLKSASDEEAKAAEATIWGIWSESGDPDIDALMEQGMAALATGDPDAARAAFDQVVKQDSGFAEGWNKRATAEFELGDFTASVVDIEHTLELEPRHFGALSGLGEIYLALGKKQAALKVFEAALAIDPQLDGVEETIEKLKQELAGSPI